VTRVVFALEYEGAEDLGRSAYLMGLLRGLLQRARAEGTLRYDVTVRDAPVLHLPETDRLHIDKALQDGGKDPATWWSARFLQLLAKSDPQHYEALRFAAPDHVAAYEAWQTYRDAAEGQWEKDQMRDPRA
jgi:hypothetical protein